MILGAVLGAAIFGGTAAIAASITANTSEWKIFVDGKPSGITAYEINGSNYLKLRDVCAAVDCGLWYDGGKQEVYIERDKGYDPDYTGPGNVTTSPSAENTAYSPSATLVYPTQDGGGYRWNFLMQFKPDTDLTIKTFVIQRYLNGKLIDDGFLYGGSAVKMIMGTNTLTAGKSFGWGDGHPVADYFDYVEYIFSCADKNGKEVVLTYAFKLSGDLSKATAADNNSSGAVMKPEDIGKLKISKILGGVTLTADEAYALVGKTPEEIKAKLQTASDMLMYMMAAKYQALNGDNHVIANGHDWSSNYGARHALNVSGGNCGATSNVANYLLEGKYEETGYLMYAGSPNTGGHVFNYIKYEGKYYIVDFVQYAGTINGLASEFPIMVLDTLEEYGKRVTDHWSDVKALIAFTSPGTHLPVSLEGGDYRFPDDAEFTVLLETPGVMKVGTLPCPIPPVPDWRLPQ